ncbi:AAA family ATPase [Leucothrix pacifica]|uniref:AAA family ATPase n=1 Tax=Leucothrix pacifica TaxID=1247513 RepID=A0A317CA17_9GAMM|nr:AAA family ATPase [Leucothrix pacifica]PWQ95376.1 AAA family ATPase [Leucothrix pacifica]
MPKLGAPFLHSITSLEENFDRSRFPFNIPAYDKGINIALDSKVTMLVGENGSGKSTLLEAVAECCGFDPEGGNRDHYRESFEDRSELAKALRLSWLPRTTEGFFLRAESFFNFATYIEEVSNLRAYGGKSLHKQSHGESFLALFENRFEHGFYILDEPEAALSPQRQLAFMSIINQLEAPGHAQFLIATHSPILLSYPGAKVISFDDGEIKQIDYKESSHYQLTKSFLDSPERYFRQLFEDYDDA